MPLMDCHAAQVKLDYLLPAVNACGGSDKIAAEPVK
jgi:hypothetical protein